MRKKLKFNSRFTRGEELSWGGVKWGLKLGTRPGEGGGGRSLGWPLWPWATCKTEKRKSLTHSPFPSHSSLSPRCCHPSTSWNCWTEHVRTKFRNWDVVFDLVSYLFLGFPISLLVSGKDCGRLVESRLAQAGAHIRSHLHQLRVGLVEGLKWPQMETKSILSTFNLNGKFAKRHQLLACQDADKKFCFFRKLISKMVSSKTMGFLW